MPAYARLTILLHALVVPLSFPLVSFDAGAVYSTDLLGVPTVLMALVGLVRPGGVLRLSVVTYLAVQGASLLQLVFDPAFVTLALKWIRLVFVFAPLILLLSYTSDEALLRRFFYLMMVAALTSLCIGILGFFYQWPLTINQTLSFGSDALIGRAGGLTKDSSAFGALIAELTVLSLIGLGLVERRSIRTAGAVAITAVTSTAMYASLSRAAAVQLAVVFMLTSCLMVCRTGLRGFFWLVCVCLAIYLVILAAPAVLPHDVLATIQDRYFGDIAAIFGGVGGVASSSSGRSESWPILLSYFYENPIFGIGYKSTLLKHGLTPDNTYIGFLTETGLLGFFGFIFFAVSLASAISRLGSNYRWMLAIVWVGFLVHGSFVDIISLFSSSTLVITVTGLILQQRRGISVLGPEFAGRGTLVG